MNFESILAARSASKTRFSAALQQLRRLGERGRETFLRGQSSEAQFWFHLGRHFSACNIYRPKAARDKFRGWHVRKLEMRAFSGCYILLSCGAVQYVGQASDVEARVRTWMSGKGHKVFPIDEVLIVECPVTELEATEKRMISELSPLYNSH